MNADRPGNGTAIPARRRGEARSQATFIGLAGLGGDAGFRAIDNRSGDPTWLEPAPRPALY